jgi:terminase large subunit-like protein
VNRNFRGILADKWPLENTQAQTPVIRIDDTDPVAFVRHRLHLDPDPPQIEVLRCTSRQGILNCTRQWGKSTIAAAKAVHRAFTQPDSEVLVASPSQRQSAEFLRKASRMVAELGILPRGDGDNPVSLLFPNGSRIVGLPGNEGTVRGFSGVSLLLIDEASRVEDHMYKALLPMLATTNGDLWLLSTPCGKRGFFYEEWQHGGAAWLRISVPATECPRIDAAFLESQRNTLEADWFAQEYLATFVDNGMSYFNRDLIEAAIDPTLKALNL